jgi:PAS domain S-box-containing protein
MFRIQWWGLLAFIATVSAIVVQYLIADHASREREEQKHLSNLATITADIIERQLLATDLLLQSCIDDFPAWQAAGDGWQGAGKALLKRATLGHGTEILMLQDVSGTVLASNRADLVGQNFSHRHYFQQARDADGGQVRIISPPFKTVYGVFSVTISRKLIDSHGNFAGVVMASLDMPFIAHLLQRMLYAPDMWTALAHGNGTQIAMIPERSGEEGRNLAVPGSFFSRHMASGKPENILTGLAAPMGEERMMAIHTVQPERLKMNFPLVIAVGRELDAIYAEWRNRALLWALVVAGFAVLLALGLAFYQRRLRSEWRTVLRKQALVDTATDGIHLLDADGRLLDANPAFLGLLGLDALAIGQASLVDFEAGEKPQETLRQIRELLQSGETRVFESSYRHRDGHLIDVEVSCRPLLLEGETVLVASARDITQRKLATEQLAQREIELNTIIESEPACVKVIAEDGRLLRMNASGLMMVGADSADQVLGQNVYDLILPRHRAAFVDLNRQVFAGGEGTLEFELQGLKGERRWLETHAVPLRDHSGRIMAQLSVTRDITERKKSERELAKLHQAVEQSPGGICITNADGVIEYVNPAFAESSGYTTAELIGQNPRILSSGRTPEEVYQSLWSSIQAGKVWVGELTNRRKDATLYIESEIISPVRQADGTISHYLALKQDITEKKRLEGELDAYRQHLEEMVEAKTIELKIANESLAHSRDAANQAARSKAAFLSNMSHEIRTPMNGIIGMLHLLRRTRLEKRQGDYLGRIEQSANHLLALINDILDLSKIDAGKLNIDSQPVLIPQILTNLKSIIGGLAHDKGLELSVAMPVLPAGLLGDATRIMQALLNYASNAVKYTEAGLIEIRTRLVEDNAGDCLVRFEVEDSGIGIPAEVMDRLFQAFEQADNSITRSYAGTGLGLAITRQLARLMGGDAGASSTPGVGSTFWFSVRLQKGGVEAPGVHEALQVDAELLLKVRHAGRPVLLVEDEPINQEISSLLLEDVGLVVHLARNGQEAIDLADQGDFALILMDMQMPVLDGLRATEAIRQMSRYRDTPILAMTANAFAEDRERCLAAGMNDFIAKPVDPDVLFQKMLRWLSPARAD